MFPETDKQTQPKVIWVRKYQTILSNRKRDSLQSLTAQNQKILRRAEKDK